jgi:hypothetical protein
MKYDINKNPKPGAVFVLSLIPGGGHMYMGLMDRGVQILIGFMMGWALLYFTSGISFIIGPAMAVIYVFNIFDAYNCRRQIQSGAGMEDEPLIKHLKIDGKTIGIGLMVLGGLGLLFSLDNLHHMIDQYYEIVHNVLRLLPSLLLLLLGVVLIINGKKGRGGKKGKQDEAA